ncbi:hypothetical protein CEQ90_00395 [Lewinellaceae bacterium SD302]|nr:hypothetical protein CEQ90_00395 [Lewinellaceae bacterium SD302]
MLSASKTAVLRAEFPKLFIFTGSPINKTIMLRKALCFTLLCCFLLPLTAQDTPKERPYRMGHTHGYFPYDKDTCTDSRSDCSQTALAAFLDSVWQHPHPAPGEPARGKVTVSFIVEKDGSLSEMKIFEDPQNGLKEAAIAALERMNELEIRWVPGEYKGKTVRSQQSLEFPLTEMKHSKEKERYETEEKIYKVVSQMPEFPHNNDCDQIPGGHQINCSQLYLKNYIRKELNYPDDALNNEVEGMVIVSLIIERDGTISDAILYKDPGYGLGEEALRIAGQMIADNIVWKPGTHEGRIVRVQYNLPVRFRLPN